MTADLSYAGTKLFVQRNPDGLRWDLLPAEVIMAFDGVSAPIERSMATARL
jgi:hypothetical protein